MLYKSLFLLVFANMFNQAYQMQNITCPKWVPGTNEILPRGSNSIARVGVKEPRFVATVRL
jgi:hypothetical protein